MMKRFVYSGLVLLVIAAPALSQQTAGSKNGTLASSSAIGASVSQPASAVRAIGLPAEKLKIAGVTNAGRISEVLLRGAQPSARGLAELKKLGITTIVDLRGNRGEVQWERAQSQALGMQFVNIPILGWSTPTDGQVAQFLRLFDENKQKVFVHCRYGEDRTGVMVATYRIAEQKWTPDDALGEMNSFGFHYHLYRWMGAYVQRFPGSYASQAAFATLRGSTAAAIASPAVP